MVWNGPEVPVTTVATWNVNSVRMRRDRLLAWLARRRPDVVALQETKVEDGAFPRADLEAEGWRVETFGQKTYNGVAILSREPARDVVRGMPGDGPDADRRLIAATVGGLKLVNVYVPNGQAVESPKFPYKLDWLSRLRGFLDGYASPSESLLVVGDFNVAPEDRDVHDPERWRGQVLFHPREHEALARVSAFGLEDLFRRHHPEPGWFSWWDYRMLAFPRNHGLRIDLILGTAAARARCLSCEIDREERKGDKPSDHAPVVAVLDD
jgi:exodeoxyribonuclease-3